MLLIFLIITSYLIGSIPVGLVLVLLFKRLDIRNIGSRNIGATNVLRVAGFKLAIVTLVIDISKGFVIAYIVNLYFNNTYEALIIGLAAVIGHVYPVYIKFKGGKGVATSLGLILAIHPLLFVFSIITWLAVALISKTSSLSSIITFITLPIYSYLISDSALVVIAFSLLSILILIKHHSNIIRVLKKQEDKLSFKKIK